MSLRSDTAGKGRRRTRSVDTGPCSLRSLVFSLRCCGVVLLVALSIDWLRRKDWQSLVAAALLAATLSQVHGIAALTAGVLVAAAAVVFLIRGDRREQLKRSGIALVALLGAVTLLHARDVSVAGRIQSIAAAINVVAIVAFVVVGAVVPFPHAPI